MRRGTALDLCEEIACRPGTLGRDRCSCAPQFSSRGEVVSCRVPIRGSSVGLPVLAGPTVRQAGVLMTVYHHLYFAPPIAAFDAVLRWIDWPRFLSSCIAARSKSHEAMANGLEGVQQDIMKTKGDIASHKAQLDAVKAELKTAQDNQIRTLLWEQLLALQEQITAMYQQLTSLLEIRNLLEGQGESATGLCEQLGQVCLRPNHGQADGGRPMTILSPPPDIISRTSLR